MKLLRVFIFLVLTSFAGWSHAQARLGEPVFRGNGCNRGTAQAVISNDEQSLSILFDDYIVEAGGAVRRNQERKTCNIQIPIEVPDGYSVAVFQIDYRGFNSLPRGAQSQFSMDYFFGGRVGPRNVQNFRGPLEADFIAESFIPVRGREWSPCGRPMVLRTNTSLMTSTNNRREQAYSAIDSADVRRASVTYHLEWRRCIRGPRGT